MANSKATKRALFSSAISLLLCFTMLMGATFAWFTDNVSSTGNRIQAGTLEVDLVMDKTKDNDYVSIADGTGDIFSEATGNGINWEPGKTEIVYLGVRNNGSLALKYNILLDVIDEGLIGSLEYAILDGKKAADLKEVEDWATIKAQAEVKDVEEGQFTAAPNGVLDEIVKGVPEETDYFALAVHMKEDAGNDYQDKGITIDVKVVATQKDAEEDSFGNDYDEGLDSATTYMFSGVDIHKSTTKSGRFGLSADIKTSDYGDDARYGYGYEYIVRNGADYTLDLNGKTIVHDSINKNANNNALTYLFVANNSGTKLTIDGDGKIYSNNSEGYTCAVQGKDGTLVTINGGDYQVDNGIAVWAGAGSHMVINGGSFVNGNAKTNHELIYSSGGVIDIYGGFFHNTDGNQTLNVEDKNRATSFINVYGGTYVNFDPSTGGQDPNNIKVMDGYKVVSETQANGDVWYTVVAE